MEDIRPYQIRNEENDRRTDEPNARVEYDARRGDRRESEDEVPFDIPRD